MGELEAALKIRLDQVVRVFDLAFGAGIAHLVDDGLDLQAAQQVLEGAAHAGAARIHHQVEGHAVHLLAGALRDGGQEGLGHVDHAFAAGHVVHEDAAAAVVGEDVAGEALALDLLEVVGLVLVELGRAHVLGAAAFGHVEQRADGGVDLPHIVGVVAGKGLRGRRLAQLLGVKCVGAQRAGHGAFAELARFAGVRVDGAGEQRVLGAQLLQGQAQGLDGFVVGAVAFHHVRGQAQRVGARQLQLAGV